jgi:hypothetical protein
MRAVLVSACLILIGVAANASAAPSDLLGSTDSIVAPSASSVLQLAESGEREGQDPDAAGEDALPGSDQPGERVGQDSDVPGGDAPGTPQATGPSERTGQDPDVPIEGGEVR